MIRAKSNVVKRQIENFWNNMHFHPTDAIEDEWGRRILDRVAEDKTAEMVRMYAMFEDMVTMDENGKLQFDFTENDVRMDYMVSKGYKLLVCYCFLPTCICDGVTPPEKGNRYKNKFICASIPRDYALWEEICYEYTKHIVERYGVETVSQWRLHCYNEADNKTYFLCNRDWTPEDKEMRIKEYIKLYEYFAAGTTRACEQVKIGGPSATSRAFEFIERFMEYVQENNIRQDFVSIHNYGTSHIWLCDGTRPFTVQNNIEWYNWFDENIYSKMKEKKEVIIDEWGASNNGFRGIAECPKFTFREDSSYAAYFGKLVYEFITRKLPVSRMIICLSGQHNLKSDFEGYRNIFGLNFIAKPIYNAFVLMRKLHNNLLESECDCKDINVIATKSDEGKISVAVAYASENFDTDLPDYKDKLTITDVSGKKHITLWKVDKETANVYRYAKNKGWGEELTREQVEELRKVGNIKPYKEFDVECDGVLDIDVEFTDNALFLAEVDSI